MTRRSAIAGLLGVVLLTGACTSGDETPEPRQSSADTFQPGAEGAGDPYFPTYGNGGYDVGGYDLKLRYDPKSRELKGTATITATATQNLSRFNLDLAKLDVSRVEVDGAEAKTARTGNELLVTPATRLRAGTAFTAVVTYGGQPGQLGNATLGQGGWLTTPDGAIALGQPESASTWFPVNDHPSDKATFKLAITVPDGVEALSNGVPGPTTKADGWSTWNWTESEPMASYLSTLVIGQYRVTRSTHAGKPMVIAVAESLPATGGAAESLGRTGEIADFLAQKFGPYPFASYGGIAIDDERIGYALETQSRPVYGASFFAGGANETVVTHELAHQWFGDSVALDRWQDIWLNEGFATYAEWMWEEHDGGPTVEQNFADVYESYPWDQGEKTGDPGADRIFSDAVYQRGGMTVYALRKTVGDKAFDEILKRWTTDYRNGNATTADLLALSEEVSGKKLKTLFDAWLYTGAKPPKP